MGGVVDSLKIASISFSNYLVHLSGIHEILQVIVALLSIYLLIMNISDKWKKILFVIVIVAVIEFSGFGIIASLLRLISSAS